MNKTKMKIRMDFDVLGTNKGYMMVIMKRKKRKKKKHVNTLDHHLNWVGYN